MNNIRLTIFLIGTGLTLGFSLMVYAHANFATKEMVMSLKESRVETQHFLREDIKEIKTDIKEILKKI